MLRFSLRSLGLWFAALLVGAITGPGAGASDPACGDADGLCKVAGGEYRLLLPQGASGPVPAIFYLRGWGASAAGALRDTGRSDAILSGGYALIVPEGIPRAGRTQRDWAVRDGRPHPRDDLAFFAAILRDAAARGVDPARVLLTGFSRGGSMVWDVACEAPGMFRAYAPLAGAFWEPMPRGCPGGVALFHTHGWTDRVVPLEGRSFRDGAVVQGDVFKSLKLLRAALGCDLRQPDEASFPSDGGWRRSWTSCDSGRIDLWLHRGGHAAPDGWTEAMLAWFGDRLRAETPSAAEGCVAAC